MHVQPISLSLSGFLSYDKPQEFLFPTTPGLYLLRGVNEIDTKLGANGSGKSALWDALCWVLYGKTSRGLRASTVQSWLGHATEVRFCYQTQDGKDNSVQRNQNSNRSLANKLLLNDDSASQEDITHHIGMPQDAFLHSVLTSQFAPLFFDIGATNKMTLLTNVLRLDRWDEYSKESKSIGLVSAANADREMASVWTLEKSIERLQEDLIETEDKLSFEKVKKIEDVERYQARLQSYKDHLSEMQFLEETLGDEEKDKLDEENQAFSAFSHLVDRPVRTHCPTCGQKWEWKKAPEEEIEKAKDGIRKTRFQHKRVKKLCIGIEGHVDVVNKTIQEIEAKILGETVRRTTRIEAYKQTIKHLKKRIANEEKNADSTRASIEKDMEAARVGKYWAEQYKHIRKTQATHGVRLFETELRAALSLSGLQNWTVDCGLYEDGKSQHGMDIRVFPPYVDHPVPWAALSGGEAQQLRLCSVFAISSLIQSHMNVQWGLEIYDEPSRHVSDEGLDTILNILYERAIRLKKIVFLTDHRFLESREFQGIAEVTKTEDGSFIRYVKGGA